MVRKFYFVPNLNVTKLMGYCYYFCVIVGDPLGQEFRPPFCDTVIREHDWFWKPNTTSKVKNVRTLVSEYLTSVGRGCHLILNLNPDPYGLVEEEDMEAYKGFGEAIGLLYKDLVIKDKNPTIKVGVEKVWNLPERLRPDNGSVIIMEDVVKFGQLVAMYQLRFKTAHAWIDYPEQGSTIGHKMIHPFPKEFGGKTITAISLKIKRLVIGDTSIRLREVSVYDWSKAAGRGYV